MPKPEGVFGRDEASAPRCGPGEFRRVSRALMGGLLVSTASVALQPSVPDFAPAEPWSLEVVRLISIEECGGRAHAKYLNDASRDAKSTSYQTLHKRLMGVDCPCRGFT
ncbi:hypothetical protein [Streptomyces sp. NPDC093248]|uniref:hypothetical protein n=1 Tax=Streptomyces sp. NPDC093248 TaxID=3155072 RepID=UPI00343A90ED